MAAKAAAVESQVYHVDEAAQVIGISYSYMWKLIYSGKVRSIKVGWRRMVPKTEVQRILHEGTEVAEKASA
jgi:excisionase family DNA binding protein